MPLVLSKNECRQIHVNMRHFVLISSCLYQRNVDGILRRCVTYKDVPSILESYHFEYSFIFSFHVFGVHIEPSNFVSCCKPYFCDCII
jgi:hypothetical protein